jgi:hypothetical protein
MKEIQQLESDMFDVTVRLHKAKSVLDRNEFITSLALLEVLNDEYNELTDTYYIDQLKMLEYHSYRWEI